MFLYSCISFDSYIKPQLWFYGFVYSAVVYLLTPTSNHNLSENTVFSRCVVYLLTPTSNHNPRTISQMRQRVVYLLTPTSNHNSKKLQ